jgi:hypothetical protein
VLTAFLVLPSPSVNGLAGGNSTVGTVDAAGNYTAPNALPSPSTVEVRAASTAKPSVHGTSTVTLLDPLPVVSAVIPTAIGLGAFAIAVSGSGLVVGSQVMFGGAPLATTFVSPTELNATGAASSTQIGSVRVTVQNPEPGGATSTTFATAQVLSVQSETAATAARFL